MGGARLSSCRSWPVRLFLKLAVVAGALAVAPTAGTTSAPKILATFRLASAPQAIVVGDGGLWVTTLRSVVRLDSRTDRVTRRVRLQPILGAVATSGRRLWVARNPIVIDMGTRVRSQLWAVDSGSGQVDGEPIRFRGIADVASVAGALWVTNGDHAQYGRLFRVDPRRRAIVATLKIPGGPAGVVAARGLLWVACSDTGYVYRVEPRSTTVTGKPIQAGKALLTLAAGRNRLWVGDSYAGAVNSVDLRKGTVVTRTKLPYVSDVAVGEGGIWATVDKPSELVRLDPSTGRTIGRALPIPGTASGLAIGFGSIWVMTGDGVVRVQP